MRRREQIAREPGRTSAVFSAIRPTQLGGGGIVTRAGALGLRVETAAFGRKPRPTPDRVSPLRREFEIG